MRFAIQHPDLGKALAETEKVVERAVKSGMRDIDDSLKQNRAMMPLLPGLGDLGCGDAAKEVQRRSAARVNATSPAPACCTIQQAPFH